MNWKTFQETAPEFARLAEERFVRSGVALLGTLHKDGSPRISPVEPLIAEGELLAGSDVALDQGVGSAARSPLHPAQCHYQPRGNGRRM